MKSGSPSFTFKPEIVALSRSRHGYNDTKKFLNEREFSEIAGICRATLSVYVKVIIKMLQEQGQI